MPYPIQPLTQAIRSWRIGPGLEQIKKTMWTIICGVMNVSRNPDARSALAGGEAPENVASKAMTELLRKDADYADSWEKLAATVARRRAIDAVRTATKNRRGSDEQDEDDPTTSPDAINLIPFDEQSLAGEVEQLIQRGRLTGGLDPEREYLEAERQGALWDLAQEILDKRERTIYLHRHHLGTAVTKVAELVDLTPRHVRNLIVEIERKLIAAAAEDPRFRGADSDHRDQTEGGSDDH